MKRFFKKRRMKKVGELIDRKESADEIEELDLHLKLMKEHLTIHFIETERISPVGETGRKSEDLTGLCDSIRRYGLLEPLVVRRVCRDDLPVGGIFTLISGKRRLDALKMLGITKAPCVISDIPAASTMTASLSASLHSLSHDLFSIAEQAEELRASTGLVQDELARRLSVDTSLLDDLSRCRLMTDEEKELCKRLDFPNELIFALARITDEFERKRAVAECGTCIRYLISSLYGNGADGKTKGIFTDVRPFYNSVDRLTAQIRSAGFAATCSKTENDDAFLVTIRVPKRSNKYIRSYPTTTR